MGSSGLGEGFGIQGGELEPPHLLKVWPHSGNAQNEKYSLVSGELSVPLKDCKGREGGLFEA